MCHQNKEALTFVRKTGILSRFPGESEPKKIYRSKSRDLLQKLAHAILEAEEPQDLLPAKKRTGSPGV